MEGEKGPSVKLNPLTFDQRWAHKSISCVRIHHHLSEVRYDMRLWRGRDDFEAPLGDDTQPTEEILIGFAICDAYMCVMYVCVVYA